MAGSASRLDAGAHYAVTSACNAMTLLLLLGEMMMKVKLPVQLIEISFQRGK